MDRFVVANANTSVIIFDNLCTILKVVIGNRNSRCSIVYHNFLENLIAKNILFALSFSRYNKIYNFAFELIAKRFELIIIKLGQG